MIRSGEPWIRPQGTGHEPSPSHWKMAAHMLRTNVGSILENIRQTSSGIILAKNGTEENGIKRAAGCRRASTRLISFLLRALFRAEKGSRWSLFPRSLQAGDRASGPSWTRLRAEKVVEHTR